MQVHTNKMNNKKESMGKVLGKRIVISISLVLFVTINSSALKMLSATNSKTSVKDRKILIPGQNSSKTKKKDSTPPTKAARTQFQNNAVKIIYIKSHSVINVPHTIQLWYKSLYSLVCLDRLNDNYNV